VRSCWPRIHSVPLLHSPAAGPLFQQPPSLGMTLEVLVKRWEWLGVWLAWEGEGVEVGMGGRE